MTSRLASLLVQDNLVAPKTMADAFQRQVIYGGTLDTILLEMNALPETALMATLGRANALPAAESLPHVDRLLAAHVLDTFTITLAEKYRAVPLGLEGHVLRVATTDPYDRRAIDQLAQEMGRPIEALITPEHRFMNAMTLVFDTALPARFQSLQARLAKRAAQTATPQPAPTPQPSPARTIVTDLPVQEGAPTLEHDDQMTPRLTTREVGAPATRVSREVAVPVDRAPAAPVEMSVEALTIADAIKAIDTASDRDAIFASLCRGARSLAEFVALFTVHANELNGRVALADRWIDAPALSRLSLPLEGTTPFRTAADGRAPLVGPVGDDEASKKLLQAMGRRAPTSAALVPVVLRDRVVAMIYADASGKHVGAGELTELTTLAAAASRAFQRLIISAKGATKGGEYKPAAHTVEAAGAKVSVSDVPSVQARGATVQRGGWSSAGGDNGGRLGATLHDAPTARHIAPTAGNLDALFLSVERGDEQARVSADQIVALGTLGAEKIVARLPGPIRIERVGLRGPTPPLADHGPLLALLARIGEAALPAIDARLDDPNPEIRYYTTLALGELGRERHVARVGKRLFDRDASVRKVAVDTLRRQPESAERTAIIESLRGELPGPERDRQRFAADALGALGDATSVPRLIELVKHDDENLRAVAHRALVAITKQDFGTSRWRWRGWWDRHKTEPRTEWLFEGLAHANDDVRMSSAQELRGHYPESFGYNWDAPKRERDEARRKWLDWHRGRRG